jgi:hypothetical protein
MNTEELWKEYYQLNAEISTDVRKCYEDSIKAIKDIF